MIKVGGESDEMVAPASLIVVQNWTEELKRLVADELTLARALSGASHSNDYS